MNPTYIGLIAGTLTSVATIPQVVKSYKTKQVSDISVWQPVLLGVGTALWLFYGIIIRDTPLILANSFSFLCNAVLIYLKFLYCLRNSVGIWD